MSTTAAHAPAAEMTDAERRARLSKRLKAMDEKLIDLAARAAKVELVVDGLTWWVRLFKWVGGVLVVVSTYQVSRDTYNYLRAGADEED